MVANARAVYDRRNFRGYNTFYDCATSPLRRCLNFCKYSPSYAFDAILPVKLNDFNDQLIEVFPVFLFTRAARHASWRLVA